MLDLIHIRSEFMPQSTRKAYSILSELSGGRSCTKLALVARLGDDPRSALQWLQGKWGGYWLIHNIADKGQPAIYLLDRLHMTGVLSDDVKARRIQRAKYIKSSQIIAEANSARLASSTKAHAQALSRLKLGEAVNDEVYSGARA